jgi:NDP-sugar pyrophosphorylase family protein
MEIRALILVSSADAAAAPPSQFAAMPLPLLDVAGRSALERLSERLELQGISRITAVIEGDPELLRPAVALSSRLERQIAPADRFWRTGENAFLELGQGNTDVVLLIHMGAYLELDLEKLVQCHLEGEQRITRAVVDGLPLGVFCVYGSRRNDAASIFRSRFESCRGHWTPFPHEGYVNALNDSHDLRQFAVDVLTLKTETRPAGKEIRPGVWVAPQADIERGARLVAPAFVGCSARIRSGAVITRCTTVEHHSEVDCGTVIENSSLLPYSWLGAGLDLSHSVAGMGHIANLRRGAIVEISDPSLFGLVPANGGRKLWNVATQFPKRLWQAIAQPAEAGLPPDAAEPERVVVPVISEAVPEAEAAGEFAPNLAVATRRYGNQ